MCFLCQPESIGLPSPQLAVLQVICKSNLGCLPKMVLGFTLLFVSIKLVFHKVNPMCRIKAFKNLDFIFAFPGVKKVSWVRKHLSSLPICRKGIKQADHKLFCSFSQTHIKQISKTNGAIVQWLTYFSYLMN